MRAFLPVLPFLAVAVAAQEAAPNPISLTAGSANDLVRKVVSTEQKAGAEDHSQWMYQAQIARPKPAETKTIVETKACDLDYVEAIGGKPLTPDERRAEDQRVQRLVDDADAQHKARKVRDTDAKQSARLFAMLPDAFLFTEAGVDGDKLKLAYVPNPQYSPHSTEAFVFHKMDGFIVVNTRENRLVEIAGHLPQRVEFAGGLFGHLDAGGTFDVQREEIAPGFWKITKIVANMNGKAVFFKSVDVHQDEVHSHFAQVAETTTLVQAEAMAQRQTAQAAGGN
jgi:hypothetical protein